MSYGVRHPTERDRSRLDDILIEDYRKSGFDKPPLTDEQMRIYGEKAWVACNQSDEAEAIALAGHWNYKTAAPYSRLSEPALRLFGKAGLFKGQSGIYVMSAVDYDEEGALSALVDETEILEPKTGAVRVPLLKNELAARAFLLNRYFYLDREGDDRITWLPGQTVETVLMTRKRRLM